MTSAKGESQSAFNYVWIDHLNREAELSFTLPLNKLNSQSHKRFIPEMAQQYVFIELHKAARKVDPKEARVEIQRRGKDISISVTSRSEEHIKTWQKMMQDSQEQALTQYLQEHYYSRFYSYLGQQAIKPDHVRYIVENANALLPVAQAVYDQLPSNSETRAYINLLLSWVQSIPYNELNNRLTSNGAGYLPPLSVIANNQGDCDSKSVLMASLIRALVPELQLIMIYLPGHALLGAALPFRTNEQTLTVNGLNYLLMEPTGPAKIALGEIASSSLASIEGNRYSVEIIPQA
ncbi:hypothetical protein [Paraglaciecola aestuariivivens]